MPATLRAVRYDRFGEVDELYIGELPMPEPGPGEVLLEVRAAGLNPGESAIRRGLFGAGPLPSGQGSDLAGVVVGIGEGVTAFAVGDEVLGYSWTRSSHATHAVVPVGQLVPKPAAVSWPAAGALYVVGVTAWAAVRAVGAGPGDVVAVSSAAGGVGTVVTQLLRYRGATVIGIASDANADWLRGQGATPVQYGDGLAGRLRAAAPDGIDAFIDLHGPEYLDLAVELGVERDRIETIISFEKAAELGTRAEGSVTASSPAVLHELAELVASRLITIEIAATYPLDDARDAVRLLEQRHTRGKLVLLPQD